MNFDLSLLITQTVIVLTLLVVIIFMFKQNRIIKYERRIGKYSIEPISYREDSLADLILKRYYHFIIASRKPMLNLFPTLSKKYEKYINYSDIEKIKPIDFITNKILLGFAFGLFSILSYVIRSKDISLITLFFSFAVGFFALDFYYKYRKKQKTKKIENEMLRAIIIMNNAFKSGKSILQAVEIASNELPEPIKDEFKKIYHDLDYGLSTDKVFERFAKRVDIEEARYISSSLTILNKTGGNIVKVFSSIEKTLFDKQKLKEELKNLTASSNLVVKVLLGVPIIFVSIIYFLNPSYFNPFFESTLGYIFLMIIFIIFILYIWFLEKIMKVKL